MLGRKTPGSGMLSAAAGMDRGRTGERLHAALAGLQELHFLRDKQSAMVHWALTLNGEVPETSKHETVSTEELRLEATLTLLKQQLTRLRKQDVGLKTHLQQLDQQINDLKLDVCKASTEHLESDSRPSSGFYELSDVGSGSLSNSCTSVYSESLSSSSQTSLLPHLPTSYAPHGRNGSSQTGVSRRCSADESTAHSDAPRSGVKLGSSCLRTTTSRVERARQRPVSTGDLDRMLAPGFGSFRSTDVKSSTPCGSLQNPSVDPKYHSNLVSSNGTEVYCYPSPLHAVALQSPIFSCTPDQGNPVALDGMSGVGLAGESQNPNEGSSNSRTAGYINKLLQRSTSKINLLSVKRNDTAGGTQEQRQEMSYGQLNGPQLLESLQQISMPLENALEPGKTSLPLNGNHQQRNTPALEPNSEATEVQTLCHVTHSTPSMDHQKNHFPIKNATSTPLIESENSLSDKGSAQFSKDPSTVPKPVERRSSFNFRREDNRASFGDKSSTPQSEFVHAQFVPAGSQRVKVRQADKKTKSVKLRKKSSEKPSAKKQQHKHLSREFCTKTRADSKQSISCKGRVTNLEESQMNSCSDCSCNGLFNSHCIQNNPHLQQSQTSRTTKSRKAPEPMHLPLDQAKKKQSSRKWPSSSEFPLPPAVQTQRSKEMLNSRKGAMVRSVSARPRSGQWGCHPRALPHSLSTSSYFNYLESRYPAAPISSRYPPRCDSEFSEYSAECASLFHSTIAASSDGEMSDYTTNRFGDSESSQGSQTASDSDSSLSLDEEDLLEEEEEDEGGLVWAQAAMGTTAAGFSLQQQHRPEPSACRIKASRALKKKIRRFQPASLKVMTLV
ncbi:dapper homolog 2 [Puntigrus tetrazona]|uniref:dapper homolog 2 n=1 Tax=Puntigrus tetrazona TaxID=1606681 RepID=UPI001C89C616|nr:dapper homolog 2 [Puntigrus tetrazona]